LRKSTDGKSEGNSIVKRWFTLESDPEMIVDDEYWIRKEIDESCDNEARETTERCAMEVDHQPGNFSFMKLYVTRRLT